MNLAEVIDGVVVNIIAVEPGRIPDWAAGWPEAGQAGPGWTWDGAAFAPPAPDPEAALEAERAAMRASRFQVRAALLAAGLLAQVEAAVAAADPFAQLAWAEAVTFSRNSPTLNALAAQLGLPPAQVDELFRAAMQIEA